MRVVSFLSAAALAALLIGCASGPASIPDEITPAELIQRGQEASDRNRFGLALEYYEAILDRFPTNIDMVCAAEYEIGFIHYKQKKYRDTKRELNALLARYDTPDAVLLPPQFRRLSVIVLEKIAEKERQAERFPYNILSRLQGWSPALDPEPPTGEG
ncbi:hypothetical protein FACS189483_06030 [Spirochaetia bacterium]|nr:hypothetical protein FACS189483_06030 [Spirochaetia bacterium]